MKLTLDKDTAPADTKLEYGNQELTYERCKTPAFNDNSTSTEIPVFTKYLGTLYFNFSAPLRQ